MVRNYKRKTMDRWSKEDLLEALLCIKDAKLKINDASRQYGISRATLYRQYQKFILAGGKCDVNQFRTCGGNPILTKVEEDVLEKTIRDLREQGFTVTSSDIKRICFEYCDSNGIPNQFNQEKRMASDDWYYGFLKRHPDVRIPKPGGGSDGDTPTMSLSGASGSSPTITAGTLAMSERPPKTKKAKSSSPHKKLLKHEQLVPSSESTVLIASAGEVTTLQDGTYVIQAPPDISTPIPPKGKKHKQAAAIIIPPASPPLKKPMKRLGDNKGGAAAKRGRKGKSNSEPEPSIPIMKQIVKYEAAEDAEEDASVGDMEEEADQEETMETGEDSDAEESAAEEEEEESGEDEEQDDNEDTVEVDDDEQEGGDDEAGDEASDAEEEQEEQDSEEEADEEEAEEGEQDQDEEEQASETSDTAQADADEESEEEQDSDENDEDEDNDNVKGEQEDSGSEDLLGDFI